VDELKFVGILAGLLVAAIALVKWVGNKRTGRKPNHPIYHPEKSKRAKHQHARHAVIHNHPSQRMHASDRIWRDSRAKTTEAHWESGVIVANKILTDSEMALEKREPSQGQGAVGIGYSPKEASKPPTRSAGERRKGR
jgi:hypothetical protein